MNHEIGGTNTMSQINITTLLLPLIISIALGFIPGIIAGKKGYNWIGFTIYGVFLFLPALIHSLIIPDVIDTTKKQYMGRALGYSILSTITLIYATAIGMVFGFDWLRGYRFNYGNKVLVFLMPFLILAAILGRKYIFSIIVYCAFIVFQLYVIIMHILPIFGGRFVTVFMLALVLTVIVSAVSISGIVVGIVLTFKYGVKGQVIEAGKGKLLFALPAILQCISFALDNIISRRYFADFGLIVTIIIEILIVVAIYALGRFLYEEAR